MSISGYVYYIKNTVTGHFYYGSRTANIRHRRTPQSDFWICYFTSSRTIKNMINEFGKEAFETSIILESCDTEEIYWAEQSLIKEHILNPLCLNKKYQDRENGNTIFSTANKPPWNKGLPSKLKGIPRDPEVVAKIKANRKGKGLGVPPPNKGKPMSPERYAQHMEAVALRKKLTGSDNPFYGKTHSQETKQKIAANTSKAQIGRPKPKKACPICGNLYAVNTLPGHIKTHSS